LVMGADGDGLSASDSQQQLQGEQSAPESSALSDGSLGDAEGGGGGAGGSGQGWKSDADTKPWTEVGPGLRDAECVVWMGDFNYRINQTYEEVIRVTGPVPSQKIDPAKIEQLLQHDQLIQQARMNKIFHGLCEIPPPFNPTYKFDKGNMTYDTSEKRRVPAWTDRILWRGSVPCQVQASEGRSEDVVVSVPGPHVYYACMDVLDSDHKPVRLELDLSVTRRIVDSKWREECLKLLDEASGRTAGAGAGFRNSSTASSETSTSSHSSLISVQIPDFVLGQGPTRNLYENLTAPLLKVVVGTQLKV
jgi:hypothetical protein